MAEPIIRVAAKEDEANEEQGELKSLYSKLESFRFPALQRARDCALVTIPTLMPPAGHSTATKYPTPYQSVGARGLNNLASKLLLAFLPPSVPPLKLDVEQAVLEQFGETRGAIEQAMSRIEIDAKRDVDASNTRQAFFEVLKQLLVAGNALLFVPPKTSDLRVFKLDRYVVKRDVMGNLLKLVIKEDISPSMLSASVRVACQVTDQMIENGKMVELYTGIQWDEDLQRYEVEQEVNNLPVPDSNGFYPRDKLPYLAVRLVSVDNEDYGRGYVEEYLGDLQSLEGLSRSIVEGSAAAAKMVWFVNPNGVTSQKTVSRAPNNAVLTGNAADVTVLQSQKQADLRVAQETAGMVAERLGYAFLLNTAVQRSGERVTAEEIRFMARELDDGLGGIYTVLTQSLLLPWINLHMDRLRAMKKIPALPKDIVRPVVSTGIEVLGRSQDLEKLQMLVTVLEKLGLMNWLHQGELITRVTTSLAVETNGLIKTQEEVDAEAAQAKKDQLAMAVAPNLTNQLGNVATTAMQAQAAPAEAPPPEGM